MTHSVFTRRDIERLVFKTMGQSAIDRNQFIGLIEKMLALEKLKKRRADTRRKIELGGLVIKSGMDGYNKSVILGALDYALELLHQDICYKVLFQSKR